VGEMATRRNGEMAKWRNGEIGKWAKRRRRRMLIGFSREAVCQNSLGRSPR